MKPFSSICDGARCNDVKPRLRLRTVDLSISSPLMGEDEGESDQQITPHPNLLPQGEKGPYLDQVSIRCRKSQS